MAAKQQDKPQEASEKLDHRQADAVIVNRVLRTLGQPPQLQLVQVRRLWGDHFRVNVFVGSDSASARVAHSYFLAADSEGNITSSSPEITKLY